MTAFVDTDVLIRHLTGDPPAQAARATASLRRADELLLPDLILAEVAYVLESFYETPRRQVAETLRAVLAFPAIRVVDTELLLRAVETYDTHRLDFADAGLAPCGGRVDQALAEGKHFRAIGRVPEKNRSSRRIGPTAAPPHPHGRGVGTASRLGRV